MKWRLSIADKYEYPGADRYPDFYVGYSYGKKMRTWKKRKRELSVSSYLHFAFRL